MKRSEINRTLRTAVDFLGEQRFHLPLFAFWTPEDWRCQDEAVWEIYERRLGWDITDFGQDDFNTIGLSIFALRNGGREADPSRPVKSYAEKVLIVEVDQVTPMHFHWSKMEDIINRGGGELVLRLYNSTGDDGLADSDVVVRVDGIERRVRAGGEVVLTPGESVTLEPKLYHKFWGRGGRVLVGEVSTVNDDARDNRFFDPVGRFPEIEEDEPSRFLLVGDYDRYYPLAAK
jgi:D-lyxose ketol-isomerase